MVRKYDNSTWKRRNNGRNNRQRFETASALQSPHYFNEQQTQSVNPVVQLETELEIAQTHINDDVSMAAASLTSALEILKANRGGKVIDEKRHDAFLGQIIEFTQKFPKQESLPFSVQAEVERFLEQLTTYDAPQTKTGALPIASL